MDDREIARWRMHSLGLSHRTFPSPTSVVSGLLGVQAENFEQASWAVASRVPGLARHEFVRQFDAGEILRTHVLRPTWHFVRPDDIRWLLELTGPRIRRGLRQLQRTHQVDDAQLDRSADVIVAALSGGEHLTRPALGERLRDAGVPAEGQRLGLMLMHAEQLALICSGSLQGTNQTYAVLEQRAPAARSLQRDAALAELVLRYFTGHGPATERDLAYWATMTLTDVRAGLAMNSGRLECFEHAGRTWWYAPPRPPDRPVTPRAHLLQVLDEYHNGYQDSRHILDAGGLIPAGDARTVGMALVDGQMVGGMRRTVRASGVTFELDLFRDLAEDETEALRAAADRYGRFLELPAKVIAAPPRR